MRYWGFKSYYIVTEPRILNPYVLYIRARQRITQALFGHIL